MEFCGRFWVRNLLSNEADEYLSLLGMQEIRKNDINPTQGKKREKTENLQCVKKKEVKPLRGNRVATDKCGKNK